MPLTKQQQKLNRRRKRHRQSRTNNLLKQILVNDIAIIPCYYCRQLFFHDDLTVEHLRPLAELGSNDLDNVVLSCVGCNQKRGRATHRASKIRAKERWAGRLDVASGNAYIMQNAENIAK